MNQNIIIGILVLLVILGGGYYFLTMNNAQPGTEATTTVSTTENPAPVITSTPSAPSVVTNSTVAPSNSTAVLTGKVTPNGAPTTYWYEYGQSNTLGNRTVSQSIGSGWSAIPSPGYMTGLSANTVYYFRLTAQNAYGTVSGTIYSFSTNNNPPPPQGTAPSVSTNAAADVTRATATLNAHVNPHGFQTTYWFEYGNSTNFGNVSSLQSAGSSNDSTAVSSSISGLDPLTKYYFRVNAQNQYGTVIGATQSFTTKGPASPGAPSADTTAATNVATSTATLNGRVNPNGAATTYSFEYSQDSLLGSILGTVTASQSTNADASTVSVSANASGLTSHTKYFYRLVATNQYGTMRGDIVSFTTKQ